MTSSADCPVPSSSNFGNQWMRNGIEIPQATAQQYEVQATGTYTVRTSPSPYVSEVLDPVQMLVTGVVSDLVESEKASLCPVQCADLLRYKTDYSLQTFFLKDLAGCIIWQEQATSDSV